MCDGGLSAGTIAALASAGVSAAGAGLSYAASRNAQAAQDAAAVRESSRQRRIQATQSGLIAKQEAEKDKGRKAFAELQPQLDTESTVAAQEQAGASRNAQYQQAMAPANADPTQGGATTAIVSDSTGGGVPVAVGRAYQAEQDKAKAYSGQQATARAYLDALADAQRQAGTTISRGAEQIGMYGDRVSGMNRPLNAWEAAKNGQAVFNAQSNAAAMEGADGVAIGQLVSGLGQAGYGLTTSRPSGAYTGPGDTVNNVAGTRTASQRRIR